LVFEQFGATNGHGLLENFQIGGSAGEGLDAQFAHFVVGTFAVEDALGRMIRVGGIVGGIVVGKLEMERGSFGEMNGFGVTIIALPVEIPLFDPDEPFFGAVRAKGVGLGFATEKMGVGIDGEDIDIDRQDQRVADDFVGGAGGEIERVRTEFEGVAGVGGRLIGEIEADGRLDGFGFAAAIEVHFDDEVAVFRKAPGEAGGGFDGTTAGIPGEELAAGHARLRIHIGEAGFAIGAVELAGLAFFIDADECVMNDLAVAGRKFDGAHEAIAFEGKVNDEIAINVAAFGAEMKGLGHGDDEIGRAELPAGGKLRIRRRQLRVAFGRAVGDPLANEREFAIGEATFVGEFAITMFREPGRHGATLDDFEDLFGAFANVLERQQIEGSGFAFVMTSGATGMDDGGNVSGESDGLRAASAGEKRQGDQGDQDGDFEGPHDGRVFVWIGI